jgi:hypothetical protein
MSFPAGTAFCKKDGTPLGGQQAQSQPTSRIPPSTPIPPEPRTAPLPPTTAPRKISPDARPPAAPARSRLPLIIGILAAVLVLGGGGIGAYFWTQRQTPDKLHAIITDELSKRQLGKVSVVVTPEWEVKISGTLEEDSQKNTALEIVKSHKEIKNVVDNVVLLPSITPNSIQEKISARIREMGLNNVRVALDKDFVVTFTGIVRSDSEKAQVFGILAPFTEIKSPPRDLIFVAPE